jgi:hypothetical protein
MNIAKALNQLISLKGKRTNPRQKTRHKIPSTSGNNVYLMPGSSATSWTLLYAPHESWRSAQELATAIKSSIMAMGKMYFFIWFLFG